MLKILLLGKSGMLGSCFAEALVKLANVELYAFGHDELDVCDAETMRKKFAEIRPELVINCTAYTAVDEAEKNRDIAFKINAEAVGNMSKLCKEYDAALLHFSTDYVFDGQNPSGYKEESPTGAINVYGESKLAGERLIARNMKKFYLIRTSWLFGSGGKNFVETMLRLGKNAVETGGKLKVVNDHIGSPTYSRDLCHAVLEYFINPFLHSEKIQDYGIYHLTNAGKCSRYEFSRKIFEIKKMGVLVNPVSSVEFPGIAKRPANSILQNTKLLNQMRDWEEALKEFLTNESSCLSGLFAV